MRAHGCGLSKKRRGIRIGQLPLELLNALEVRLTTNDLSKQRTVALKPKVPVRILLVNVSVVHDAKAHGRSMPNVAHQWRVAKDAGNQTERQSARPLHAAGSASGSCAALPHLLCCLSHRRGQ